ncbi:LysR substrate-binding domain-containing protein [Cupriavidus basilensis]|uniref:LysR substrate-binding domain-containing protein n=1 Tax=Cupriavidus basilensis TaxID=68895 RepID=UPI003464298A
MQLRLIARKIADNRRLVCAAPSCLKAHGTPSTPHDLAQHQCVVLRQNDSAYGIWRFTKGKKTETVKVRAPLSSNDGEVTLTWGLDGQRHPAAGGMGSREKPAQRPAGIAAGGPCVAARRHRCGVSGTAQFVSQGQGVP